MFEGSFLQNYSGYPGAGLSIGQCMMMIGEVITTVFRYRMQLMVGQLWESLARSHTGAMELVIRIVHLIAAEHGFQATLIERFIMGHKRKPFDEWFYLFPHFREYWCIFCIFASKAMNLAAPVIIIIWFRLDQGIERIHNLAISHNHHTNRTNTSPLIVGCLEIYRSKVSHNQSFLDVKGPLTTFNQKNQYSGTNRNQRGLSVVFCLGHQCPEHTVT